MTKANSNTGTDQPTRNRNVFFICLLVASVFWIASKFGDTYSQDYTFKLDYQFRNDLIFKEIPFDQVVATITGTGWELFFQSLPKDHNTVKVPLRTEKQQRISRSYIIDRLEAKLDSRALQVERLNIDYIDINLEQIATKQVPINLIGDIQAAPGFTIVGGVKVTPGNINIAGPQSLVDGITRWDLRLQEIAPLDKDFSKTYEVQSVGNGMISIAKPEVVINVDIEVITEKSVRVPIKFPGRPMGHTINPNEVKVTFNVGLSRFEEVKVSDFEVEIVVTDLESEVNSFPLALTKWPYFVENVKISPKSAQFLIIQDSVLIKD